MRVGCLLLVSCISLVSACGTDDPSYTGSGSGAASVEDVRYTSLSSLKVTSELAVEGTIISASVDPAGTVVSMNVVQTLLSTSGNSPSTVSFVTASGDDAAHVSIAGDSAIVFLVWTSGKYVINGGSTGYFRVADGMVTPIAADGVSLPANTDVPGFVAEMERAEAALPDPGIDYGGGIGGGY